MQQPGTQRPGLYFGAERYFRRLCGPLAPGMARTVSTVDINQSLCTAKRRKSDQDPGRRD
jgi:hypothetical protein